MLITSTNTNGNVHASDHCGFGLGKGVGMIQPHIFWVFMTLMFSLLMAMSVPR